VRSANDEHVYSDAHHSISTCGNAIMTYSANTPNPRYLQAWDQATTRLAARVEGSIVVVTIIDSRSPSPSEAERKAIRETITEHKHQIAALAYVVEGRGFGAAAMRSALSLMSLAARYPFPQKVFSSIEDSAAWVARASGPGGMPARFIAAAEMMRGQVRLAAVG
jgi:hypothetical protein